MILPLISFISWFFCALHIRKSESTWVNSSILKILNTKWQNVLEFAGLQMPVKWWQYSSNAFWILVLRPRCNNNRFPFNNCNSITSSSSEGFWRYRRGWLLYRGKALLFKKQRVSYRISNIEGRQHVYSYVKHNVGVLEKKKLDSTALAG